MHTEAIGHGVCQYNYGQVLFFLNTVRGVLCCFQDCLYAWCNESAKGPLKPVVAGWRGQGINVSSGSILSCSDCLSLPPPLPSHVIVNVFAQSYPPLAIEPIQSTNTCQISLLAACQSHMLIWALTYCFDVFWGGSMINEWVY